MCEPKLLIPDLGIKYNRTISLNGFVMKYNDKLLNELVEKYIYESDGEGTWWGKQLDFEYIVHSALGINKTQVSLTSNFEVIKRLEYYFNGILFQSTRISPFSPEFAIKAFNEARVGLLRILYNDENLRNEPTDLSSILTALIEDTSEHPWMFIKGLIVKSDGEYTIADHTYKKEAAETYTKGEKMASKNTSNVTSKSSKKKTVTVEYGKPNNSKTTDKSAAEKKSKSVNKPKETLADKATKELNKKSSK